MPTDTNNRTFNTTDWAEGSSLLPAWQCTPWIVLLILESLAIIILNFITIMVFLTQRPLQRRGIYSLMRHLAMVDLLNGAISGPLQIERFGEYCDLWEYNATLTWGFLLKFTLLHLFPFASLANLVAISLERVHVTFWPFSPFLTKKRTYSIIVVIWLIAVIREVIQIAFYMFYVVFVVIGSSLYISYYLISLLIICVSYISIFLKMRFGARVNSINHSTRIARERRLTATLFTVTVASLLSLLPAIIYIFLDLIDQKPPFHIRMVVLIFFMANSLANPIIYSMKLRGFRAGLANLFKRTPAGVKEVALPLPQIKLPRDN